jgi:hypothetical protein
VWKTNNGQSWRNLCFNTRKIISDKKIGMTLR